MRLPPEDRRRPVASGRDVGRRAHLEARLGRWAVLLIAAWVAAGVLAVVVGRHAVGPGVRTAFGLIWAGLGAAFLSAVLAWSLLTGKAPFKFSGFVHRRDRPTFYWLTIYLLGLGVVLSLWTAVGLLWH